MRSPRWDNMDENTEAAWSKPDVHKHTNCAHKQEEGVLRCGKSGRLRRINRLRPHLKRFYFGEDEEDLIIKLHALLGNRWSLIAGRLPGRTDDQIKNYWNTHLKRKLVSLGIDPDNHRPNLRIDLWRQGSLRECAEHKDLNSEAHNDETSDGTSCLGDNSHCGPPDLNLNLTISTSSSLLSQIKPPQYQEKSEAHVALGDDESAPTLLLFR